jgi:hypothetical protein
VCTRKQTNEIRRIQRADGGACGEEKEGARRGQVMKERGSSSQFPEREISERRITAQKEKAGK